MNHSITQTLYEQDFSLWVKDTVEKLKAKNTENLDWEHLIEEIEGLTRSDRREIKHRLITLFEHALKRRYVPLNECYRGWELTIKRTQSKLQDILEDSPSLRSYLLEIIPNCYQEALENVRIEYDSFFPDEYIFSEKINLLLTQKIWE
ncbi:MAG: DUF29 domain-containing protein [Snowella sp.]|jgi:hypothetical protein|nr:MAG: DUF29 domain-containing protein [Snowella sp.]